MGGMGNSTHSAIYEWAAGRNVRPHRNHLLVTFEANGCCSRSREGSESATPGISRSRLRPSRRHVGHDTRSTTAARLSGPHQSQRRADGRHQTSRLSELVGEAIWDASAHPAEGYVVEVRHFSRCASPARRCKTWLSAARDWRGMADAPDRRTRSQSECMIASSKLPA